MIETKKEFYVLIQKNLLTMRSLMETSDLLASLPSKICECVKKEGQDGDLKKYAELFETKSLEHQTGQAEYEERSKELSEARNRLFANLPDKESVEETSSKVKHQMSDLLYKFMKAISEVQKGISNFREEHPNKTDIDDSVEHLEVVVAATYTLLTDQVNATTDRH